MDEMLKIAADEGILVDEFPLTPPLFGLYIQQRNKPPLIALSSNIRTEVERRCILAEELGHHFTTVGNCVPKEFYHYSLRMLISKNEYKALKWAAEYLMPQSKILTAFDLGVFHTWELADYFDVTEEMVRFRFTLSDVENYRLSFNSPV